MRPEEIHWNVHKKPFEPFRIFLSDGSSRVVENPELIVVLQRHVFLAVRRRRGGLPKDSVWLDPFHVTRVEPINGSGARQGRRGKR